MTITARIISAKDKNGDALEIDQELRHTIFEAVGKDFAEAEGKIYQFISGHMKKNGKVKGDDEIVDAQLVLRVLTCVLE